MRKLSFLSLLLLVLSSCDSNLFYESSTDISEEGWRETQVMEYVFNISDTSEAYKINYLVRYSSTYPNYNLYVKDYIADSSGKVIFEKLQGMDLFKPTSGAPYGSGFGGNFDLTVLGIPEYKFPHKGKYIFKIKQYMRQDPLKGILAFGIRLEKAHPPQP